MLVKRLSEDENVVKVDNDDAFVDEVAEQLIHHGLERSRRIGKAEEHDGWFEEAHVGTECSLPLVAFFDADLIRDRSKHFGEGPR